MDKTSRYSPRDFPHHLPTTSAFSSMAKNPLDGVCWEGTFQGKPYYSAKCDIEALIISQLDDNLPRVADAVPRLNCELMDSDQNQLKRLGLLKTSTSER